MAIFVSVVQTARERSREHLPQTVDDTTYTPSSSPLHANTQTHVLVPHVMCVPQSLCFATLIRCAFATDSYAFEANAIQIVRCTASSMPFDRQKLTIWSACKWMQCAIVSAIENEISSHNSPNATISMHLKFIVVLFHSFAGFNQMEIFEGKMCCRRRIVTGIRFVVSWWWCRWVLWCLLQRLNRGKFVRATRPFARAACSCKPMPAQK